ncbi:uncharacterized protein LOC135692722 isoform X2 [Rhopilema esculentum]|uniref:uncharacterized protein LOC135692722 isoform X2 n=1 Tax=Rhopilema esculentum TaxID=499914 RepID=UPI0031D730D9
MEARMSRDASYFFSFIIVSEIVLKVYSSNFIIERRLQSTSNITTAFDVFTNPGGCFRARTCASLRGYCYQPFSSAQIPHCCSCECKGNKNLLYSLLYGCTTGYEANEKTKMGGKGCMFYMTSFGASRIPTITGPLQLNQSGTYLKLSSNNRSLSNILSLRDTWCFPRRIYYLTKFGKERLIFENSCLETMDISMIFNSNIGSFNHYLKFIPSNQSEWDVLNGKLLKIEIICKSRAKNTTKLASCIVLRINGTYNDDVPVVSHHSPLVCPPPPPYLPPTTTVPPTPSKRKSSAYVVGGSVGASLLLVIVAILAVIIIRKRKSFGNKEVQVEMVDEGAGQPFLDENIDSPSANTAGVNSEPVVAILEEASDAAKEKVEKDIPKETAGNATLENSGDTSPQDAVV